MIFPTPQRNFCGFARDRRGRFHLRRRDDSIAPDMPRLERNGGAQAGAASPHPFLQPAHREKAAPCRKHDFTAAEFAARRDRQRRALDAQGLMARPFHPVSIHWLTARMQKATRIPVPLLRRRRGRSSAHPCRRVAEFLDDALVDEVVGWGGGIAEEPLSGSSGWPSGWASTWAGRHRGAAYTCTRTTIWRSGSSWGAASWPSPPTSSTTSRW